MYLFQPCGTKPSDFFIPKIGKSIFLIISAVGFGSLVIALYKMDDDQRVKELFEIIALPCQKSCTTDNVTRHSSRCFTCSQ